MKYTFSLLALINLVALTAQVDRSIRPEPAEAKKIELPTSSVTKLENGLTVILSENHKTPRVSFSLFTGSDPRMENDKAGLSEMTGALIMSGTENRDKDKLDREIDFIGASLDASPSSLSLRCLTKHMDQGLELMTDVLNNANFPESEVERIRKMQESALLSAKSEAGTMAQNATVKVNFPNHPYSNVMTDQTLQNITKQDIEKYFKNTFVPEGAYLVVVGDITKERLKEVVGKYFISWKGGPKYQGKMVPPNRPKGNQVTFVEKKGAVQSVVYITFPVMIKSGDKNELKLDILNGILGGGGFGTRLMQNLREDKAYTYGCYSRMNVTENGSWMSAGGNFRNEVTDSAITQILKEFENIGAEFVKADELNLTKASRAGGFARSLENPATIARFALNTAKYNLPDDYYQNYLQSLDAITVEDIYKMANEYFTSTRCNIIVVGNPEILDKLKPFDADGEITILDEFGNEKEEMMESDLPKEQIIQNYLFKVTNSSSEKELNKKIKKIKSLETIAEMTSSQMPMPLKMFSYHKKPSTKAQAIEFQGNKMPISYTDGKIGFTSVPMQGKKDMTSEEISKAKKEWSVFASMNYLNGNWPYEVMGIQKDGDTEYYVIYRKEDETEHYEYYNKNTFLREKNTSIVKEGEKTSESTQTFSDYREVNGFLFPHAMTQNMGPMVLTGTMTEIKINKKIDLKFFKQ